MGQNNSRTILKEMQKEFAAEKNALLEKVKKNDNKIVEIERYLASLFENEDRDYKVFSPRDIESVYKNKINQEKENKIDIENENQSLYKRIGFFADKLDKFDDILSDWGEEDNETTSCSMIEMQEQERLRIARDLHDSIVQNLVHVIHKIELSSKVIDKDPIQAKLELHATKNVVKDAIEELRNTIYNLRPMDLDDFGFLSALERLRNELEEKADKTLQVLFQADPIEEGNEILVMALYRMIQECCKNVVKHANATVLTLKLKNLKTKIKLEIKDNGIGFDVDELKEKKKNFGLCMTRERVELLKGTMQISSKEGNGTTILIELPK